MTPWADGDYRDDIRSELRAEAAAERRRMVMRNHWCALCHGHTGPGSPCAPDEDEPQEDEETEDEEES